MIGARFAFYHYDGIFLQLTTLKISLPEFFVVVWLLNRKWCVVQGWKRIIPNFSYRVFHLMSM